MSRSNSYRNAQAWFLENFGSELRNQKIRYFIMSNSPTTKEEIENIFCQVDCVCELPYPERDIINIKKLYLQSQGTFYRCNELTFVYQYYVLNKTVPTENDLIDFIRNALQFELNPEEYHQKDKVLVPTLNLDKLSPIIKDTYVDSLCSLCQNDIGNHSFFKIPPCNHMFHATKEECLGEYNIIDWLSSHTQCPNCKIKVSIN